MAGKLTSRPLGLIRQSGEEVIASSTPLALLLGEPIALPLGWGSHLWRPHTYPSAVRVRPLRPDDYPAVAAIFADGIATRVATFETTVPSWEEWDAAHLPGHRLVAELDGEVAGWCAIVPYSRRAVYRGVGEESVYVAERARGRGIGRALLEAVIESARAGGLWTLQAGIFPDNGASLAVHRAVGFREVGVRERIAQLDGAWRDVVLLELRL
jgi:L-amino acid N-acyltransferase YncA